MSYDPQKVIDIALAEEGYLEKKTNSNLDSKTANAGSKNYTKYGRDLDALGFYNGRKNGVAWCDQFVDWCMVQAYGMEVALAITFQPYGKSNCGAGCQYSRNYYKNNGRLFDKPQPGDQIFFWDSAKSRVSHTGLVYHVDKTYVYTIEGNTSGASGVVANGGGVKKKKYKLNYARLAGFGRPNWGALAPSTDKPAATPETTVRLGDRTLKNTSPDMKGADILELQKKLNSLGFDCGEEDGVFGTNTEKGVKKFQSAANLESNGEFGFDDFEALKAYSIQDTPNSEPSTEKVEKKVASARSRDTSLSGVYLVMVQQGLNMRYKPGIKTSDNVVRVLPDGATVRNYGYFTEVDGVKWLYVAYGGQTGFVSAKYLHRVG